MILTVIAVLTVFNTFSKWTGKKDVDTAEISKLRDWQSEIDNWRNNLFYSLSKEFVSKREYDKDSKNLWHAIDRKIEK